VRQGAEVIFLDVADEDSKALAEQLSDAPIAPVYIRCDLTDLDAVAKTFAEIGPSTCWSTTPATTTATSWPR
jgi:NAD(P)-dependent dehydrogenase (short-subunit alcohol dehydrogenase family)